MYVKLQVLSQEVGQPHPPGWTAQEVHKKTAQPKVHRTNLLQVPHLVMRGWTRVILDMTLLMKPWKSSFMTWMM